MAMDGKTLAVVIPAYNAEATIESVVGNIPSYVDWIIIINDKSLDNTEKVISGISDHRVFLINNEKNRDVGGVMITGFKKILDLKADYIAKIDADDQMDPRYLDRFTKICLLHNCDYVKANRFGHMEALSSMPGKRLIGNILLSFLTKPASGYWNVFDPQNGYIMLTRKMLRRLDLNRIDHRYFFENSMFIMLNILRARIGEIYLPAQYANEASSMKLINILVTFPKKLCGGFIFRIYQKYIFRSLSPFFLLLGFALTFCTWGFVWGGWAWYKSYITDIPATTGTVVIALLPIILGFSALLQAFVLDAQEAGPCLLFDFDDEELNSSLEKHFQTVETNKIIAKKEVFWFPRHAMKSFL
jgi:glycosyltransferase involved in cell wall biosynthesis